MEAQGGRVVFSYPEAWGPLAFTGVMVSSKTIAERPDTVRKFIRAYQKAFQMIQADRERALEIAAKQLPNLDKAIIRRALERLISSGSIPASVEVNPESWRKLLQIRLDVGDIKKMPEAQLYDNSFLAPGK